MRNKRKEIIQKLERIGKPLLILGTGRFGKVTAEYVLDHGLKIQAFLDKEEYYFEGKKIKIRNQIIDVVPEKEIDIYPELPVLIGLIDYSEVSRVREKVSERYVEYLDVIDTHVMTDMFWSEHENDFRLIEDGLEDNLSKEILKKWIYSRRTGDIAPISDMCMGTDLYDWKLLEVKEEDLIVDGGAFTGDTIAEIRKNPEWSSIRVIAFEPDKRNYFKLCQTYENDDAVTCVNGGLWNETGLVSFTSTGTVQSKIATSNINNVNQENAVQVYALDEYFELNKPGFTVLKADIEGAELQMILGGYSHICKYMPNLAICIYHTNKDLIEIFNLLKDVQIDGKKYHFYLRQHSHSVEETVLYAVK